MSIFSVSKKEQIIFINKSPILLCGGMARKDRMFMPQSTAGLIRYFEESEETIKLRPEHVIGIALLIIIIELIVKFSLI